MLKSPIIQVVDKGGQAGNYFETSGSAMFVYALKTAVDSGWINSSYLTVAQKGWTGLKTKISTYSDGKPAINDFAPAMSVQDNYNGYVSVTSVDCPTSTAPHGYAAILMAASVMEFPLTTLPVKFVTFTAKENSDRTTLLWKIGDESDVSHYEVQKSTGTNSFKVIGQVPVAGRSAYSFDDNTVESKTVYYRINAVYKDNSSHYSTIASVKRDNHAPTFEILPNPVKAGELNAMMTNLQPGKYNICITSAAGSNVYTASLTILGETSGQHIQLPPCVTKGIYYVQLRGVSVTINKNIVVE